jgi:hypothetical protein
MAPTSLLPAYASEVRFYRDVLGIAYETGSKLRKLGVLTPDPVCDDERPIFLLSPESIQTAEARINTSQDQVIRIAYLCGRPLERPIV